MNSPKICLSVAHVQNVYVFVVGCVLLTVILEFLLFYYARVCLYFIDRTGERSGLLSADRTFFLAAWFQF